MKIFSTLALSAIAVILIAMTLRPPVLPDAVDTVNADGTTYFVSPTGNDANSGSETSPWRSVAAACAKPVLQPGDVLRILPGTYIENTTIRVPCGVDIIGSGTTSTIIKGSADTLMLQRQCENFIKPQHIQDFKLDGQEKSAGRIGLYVTHVSGVYIHDLFVEKFKGIPVIGTGIAICFSDNVRVYDCVLKHNATSGSNGKGGVSCGGNFGFGGVTNCEFYNIDIEDNQAYGVKGSVTEKNDVRNTKIFNFNINVTSSNCESWGNMSMELFWVDHYGNEIFNNHVNNVISLIPGFNASRGNTVRIHHNFFDLPSSGNVYGIEADTHDKEVDHNYFKGGLYSMALSSGRPATNGYKVHHNVFDDQRGPTAVQHFVPGTNNSKFYNNTVVLRRTFQNGGVYLGTSTSDIDFKNNLFVSTVANFGSIGVTQASTFNTNLFYNVTPRGNDALTSNPLLPLTGGWPAAYVPPAGSPVLDRGVPIPGYTDDSNGDPDLGAFEVGGETWPVGPQPTYPAVASIFKSVETGAAPLAVAFDGSYSLGENLTYAWDFGNGQTSAAASPNVVFSQAGLYTVTLTITDGEGNVSQRSTEVTVYSENEVPGLNYQYFEGTWSVIPDFGALSPVKSGVTLDFDRTERNQNNNYGMSYEGKIRIAAAGSYTFYTYSDDGSNLYINNNLVVDNDGLHVAAEESGTITLPAGDHDFRVDYIQGGGDGVLQVRYAGPGIAKQQVPFSILFAASGGGPSNAPPTANAGADLSVTLPADSIQITGSGEDTDGTIAAYAWTQVSGPSQATLTNDATPVLTASELVEGVYEFNLLVTDNGGATASDQVQVTVNPATGAGPSFFRGINLNGSATTIDGNNWEGKTAPNLTITGGSFENQSVTLNPATDAARASMIRSSNWGNNGNLSVSVGAVPDGIYDVFLYVWEDNANAVFSVALEGNVVQPNYSSGSAGAWSKLGPWTVNITDGDIRLSATGGDANFSGIEIWSQSGSNTSPGANAGDDVSITLPTNSASLTGAGTDADGTVVGYLWTQTGGPSTATLSGAETATMVAADLVEGVYTFNLRVTDNDGATGDDEVMVTVNAQPSGCSASGAIRREVWRNVSGASVASIPVNTTPTETMDAVNFQLASPTDGENYGARYRGYLCAPESGDYTFFISSDDASQLFLSTDDDPGNKAMIAQVTTYVSSPGNWSQFPSQASPTRQLVAGELYYIEALHKEAIGGDHFAVGWRTPSMAASATPVVIPGAVLSPFVPEAPTTCTASGTLLREVWNNVSGTGVASIPVNNAPSAATQLGSFEGPRNVTENYGARYSGYLCAPATGNYTFFISSDDNGVLRLSTDESAANLQDIAAVNTYVSTPNNFFQFASQQSAAIPLVAGQAYYFEALHKEGTGSDHFSVAWRTPAMSATAAPVVIPGTVLSPPGGGSAQGRMGYAMYVYEPEGEQEVMTYPNPTRGDVIRIAVGSLEVRQVALTSSSGAEIAIAGKTREGNDLVIRPAQKLASGAYIVNLRTDQGIVIRRVMVAN